METDPGSSLPAPAFSLEKAMQYIKGGSSFRAEKEQVYPGSVWQPSFDNHRIRGAIDYERHRNYIHQNRVRRGLCRFNKYCVYADK